MQGIAVNATSRSCCFFLDYEYEISPILSSTHVRTSVILAAKLDLAVVILLRVLARMSQWREQVIKCRKFYLFAVGRWRTNVFGEMIVK